MEQAPYVPLVLAMFAIILLHINLDGVYEANDSSFSEENEVKCVLVHDVLNPHDRYLYQRSFRSDKVLTKSHAYFNLLLILTYVYSAGK